MPGDGQAKLICVLVQLPKGGKQGGQIGAQDDDCIVATSANWSNSQRFPAQPLGSLAGRVMAIDAAQATGQRQVNRIKQCDDFVLRGNGFSRHEKRGCRYEIADFGGLNDQNTIRLYAIALCRAPP